MSGLKPSSLKPSSAGGLQVVAAGLDNPRHLTIGPDGNLYVAEAGHGGTTATGSCYNTTDPDSGQATTLCAGPTGAIARITPAGAVSTALSGLPSVADPTNPEGASGPAGVSFVGGKLQVVLQESGVAPYDADEAHGVAANPNHDGSNPYGLFANAYLGHLVTATPGSTADTWNNFPNFALFEGLNNPDNGPPGIPGESPWDSDPYAVTPYQGGYAVADAAANDLLWVDSLGAIHLLAVFPPQQDSQSVPTSVAVGPDGALYVGELAPGPAGTSRVWRVADSVSPAGVPTVVTPTVYASGFSAITDLAFDSQGRLIVLEFDVKGLFDNPQGGLPASGAVVRVETGGSRTTLASQGLLAATGLAIAADDTIYVSNLGSLPAQGDPTGLSGQVVKIPAAPGGYRVVGSDGGVFNFGDNAYFGSTGGAKLNKPIVGSTATSNDKGYWLVASDGGVFTFGDAAFYGSTGNVKLNQPIVGIAAAPDGGGYWLVASDGGVFNFSDPFFQSAGFYGSTGNVKLAKPIVGIRQSLSGKGYWLVASDGGVFNFGDASFQGSTGGVALHAPIVGIN